MLTYAQVCCAFAPVFGKKNSSIISNFLVVGKGKEKKFSVLTPLCGLFLLAARHSANKFALCSCFVRRFRFGAGG